MLSRGFECFLEGWDAFRRFGILSTELEYLCTDWEFLLVGWNALYSVGIPLYRVGIISRGLK
jgi:hypothetical protein